MSKLNELQARNARTIDILGYGENPSPRKREWPLDIQLCETLIEALRRDQKVSMAQVRKALGSHLAQELDDALLANWIERDMLKKAALALRSYTRMLRVPDGYRLNNRRRNISKAAKARTEKEAYRLYGLALEHLGELIAEGDPSLAMALDDEEWDRADPDRVPRVKQPETNVGLKPYFLKRAIGQGAPAKWYK